MLVFERYLLNPLMLNTNAGYSHGLQAKERRRIQATRESGGVLFDADGGRVVLQFWPWVGLEKAPGLKRDGIGRSSPQNSAALREVF